MSAITPRDHRDRARRRPQQQPRSRAPTSCAASPSGRSGWSGSIRRAAWPGAGAIPKCRAIRPSAPSSANAPPRNSSNARCRISWRAISRSAVPRTSDDTRRSLLDALARQRQVAQPLSRGVGDGVCNRCRRRSLPGFAAAEERQAGPVDDVDLDAVRHRIETQDRIGLPVDAGDPGVVEGHAFVQRPAHRLHDRAFDLVDQPVRIDHLAAVDGRHRADQTRTAGLPLTSTSEAMAQ